MARASVHQRHLRAGDRPLGALALALAHPSSVIKGFPSSSRPVSTMYSQQDESTTKESQQPAPHLTRLNNPSPPDRPAAFEKTWKKRQSTVYLQGRTRRLVGGSRHQVSSDLERSVCYLTSQNRKTGRLAKSRRETPRLLGFDFCWKHTLVCFLFLFGLVSSFLILRATFVAGGG